MHLRALIGALALLAGLTIAVSDAFALDDSQYPAWRGQWRRIGGIQWDPSRKLGRDEQPPLKPQYQALFEASLADQAAGGQGNDPTFTCIPPGMPRAMTVVFPMEIIIMPDTTYMIIEYDNQVRRIYTDGRPWPKDTEPAFAGYSIGHWTEPDAQGRFTTLEVETRGFKGPRSFDASGIPLHEDNLTVVKERIYLDKDNGDLLHDEVTTIDNALTQPWTVLENLSARERADLVRLQLPGRQSSCAHRQGELLRQRGRRAVAVEEGPDAAAAEVFRSGQEVKADVRDTSWRRRMGRALANPSLGRG